MIPFVGSCCACIPRLSTLSVRAGCWLDAAPGAAGVATGAPAHPASSSAAPNRAAKSRHDQRRYLATLLLAGARQGDRAVLCRVAGGDATSAPRREGHPVAAQQLAHRRARPDLGEPLV